MLQKNSQDMRLQENHGLQNSPWGGGKPYLASGLKDIIRCESLRNEQDFMKFLCQPKKIIQLRYII